MNLTGVLLPFVGVLLAIVLLWDQLVDWTSLAVLAGDVRHQRHGRDARLPSPAHAPFVRNLQTGANTSLAIVGSMAVQGPVMNWVADHRKHHAHTDQEGDPHTPHGHGSGFKGAVTGLWYAHMGWLFEHSGTSEHQRYCRDLYEDRGMQLIHKTFAAVGGGRDRDPGARSASRSPAPGAARSRRRCGAARCGSSSSTTSRGRSTPSATSSVRRRFAVDDHSTNVFWLSLLSMGESWHHNHHTFPRSAFHGLRAGSMRPDRLGDPRDAARRSWPGTWSRSRPSASSRSSLPEAGLTTQ